MRDIVAGTRWLVREFIDSESEEYVWMIEKA